VSQSRKTAERVRIIPLEISIPHDDLWVTILMNKKEQDLFTLFGGGQEASPITPQRIPLHLKKQLLTALTHTQYLKKSLMKNIYPGIRIPIWEVALPAGHYKALRLNLRTPEGVSMANKSYRFRSKKVYNRLSILLPNPLCLFRADSL